VPFSPLSGPDGPEGSALGGHGQGQADGDSLALAGSTRPPNEGEKKKWAGYLAAKERSKANASLGSTSDLL